MTQSVYVSAWTNELSAGRIEYGISVQPRRNAKAQKHYSLGFAPTREEGEILAMAARAKRLDGDLLEAETAQ